MEQVELKPCPFCGEGMSPMFAETRLDGELKWFDVTCYDCNGIGPHKDTKEAAAEAWNTRTNDQAKDEEIARLKGALVGAFETMIYVFKTSDDPATADAAEVLADEIEAAILGASNG